MFIVFEGIDGSGKTTLSGHVAERLAACGLSVKQARPKGELKSRVASEIRTIARDPRNLTISPHTELFLFIARDTQTVDTVIRPHLDKSDIVIADRYLYSAEVLCRARGKIPPEEISGAVRIAARGLWPDIVIYCDVDIRTSAIRKSIAKIYHPKKPEDFGRKGLRGLGLRDEMRRIYLEMAAADPAAWFVVDNARNTIEENTAAIVNHILRRVGRPPLSVDASGISAPRLALPADCDSEDARRIFYDHIRALVHQDKPAEAAYHLRSLGSEEAWALRDKLEALVPEVAVYGITPLSCERSMAMRRRLLSDYPTQVARSLGARWSDAHEEAWSMRDELAETAPEEVAATLKSLDSPSAWEMRERLASLAPTVVLSSLQGLDSESAWAIRAQWHKKKAVPGLLRGLGQIDTERAWELRHKHQKQAMPWVILSLLGIETDAAWQIRTRFLETAAKLVFRSMSGSLHPTAWQMRRDAGHWAKESLTTIKGIDTPEAWALRTHLAPRWPGAASKSVGLMLAVTDKGLSFLRNSACANPDDPDTLHYWVKAIEAVQEHQNA